MSTQRIKQAVAKVVRKDKTFFWIRISRAYMESIASYWWQRPDFYYMKIYEFNRNTRQVGKQLAYITLTKYEML